MNSIVDDLNFERRQRDWPMRFTPVCLGTFEVRDGTPISDPAIVHCEEYLATFTVHAAFRCNRVMYEDAVRDVKKVIARRLYGHLIPKIEETREAIRAGQGDEALKLLVDLESMCE